MPKPKQFLKDLSKKKSSKRAPPTPENADEYLAAGVDFEEAGEKWRGGDAAKSVRFFVRAIDLYDEALKRFPTSFDLAYNKARVQYELTQYPRLLAQLPGTLVDLLKTALDSSRIALNLKQDNADVLFNTAQVLTSLVEAITDSRELSKEACLPLLEEAIELFQRCLTLQEYNFAESQARQEIEPSPDPEIPDPENDKTESQNPQEEEERWAMVLEPVTTDTLLDTVLAQLETLATLCGLVNGDEGRGLAWIEEYSNGLLSQKLTAYVKDSDRTEETALTRANFTTALADANFRNQRIDAVTYQRALEAAYGQLDISNDPEGLCDKAEALIAYNTALRVQGLHDGPTQWKALSTALESLTAASKLPSADNVTKIHLTRGDVELLRFQLGRPPIEYVASAKNGPTLLKNAATFYRGADGYATASELVKEHKEATVKLALTMSLGGERKSLQELIKTEPSACQEVLEEAVDDGLITIDWLVQENIMR